MPILGEDGMQELDLQTLGGGVAFERFEDALQKVIENIDDPNTEAKETRKITLVVTFKPDETRARASMTIGCKTTLAPVKAIPDQMFIGKRRGSNKLAAARYDPAQLQLGQKPEDGKILPISKSAQGGE